MKNEICTDDRLGEIYRFIIEGQSNVDIIEYLETQKIQIKDAKLLFEDALKRFVKSSNLPKSVRKGWCFEAYRDLYRRLVETGDYSGALKAVHQIAKLAGLNEKNEQPIDLKDEIDEYIENVMAIK